MKKSPRQFKSRVGFTLLELIVAIVIFSIIIAIVSQTFNAVIHGWQRGTEILEDVQHGEYAINKLSQALDSTLYFYNPRKRYAFLFEKKNSGDLPTDSLSFVTVSPAFMPRNSPLRNGPHRIKIYIDDDENGEPALFSKAVPALVDMDDKNKGNDPEPYLVSRAIQGLEILVYNEKTEEWEDTWEKKNSVPERIKVSLFVPSINEEEKPVVFTRVIDIPVAKSVKIRLKNPTKTSRGRRINERRK